MKPRTTHSSSFDEWPLVAFTTLAIMGAGLFTTPFLAWATGHPPAAVQSVLWLAPLLLGGGLVISQAHLGQPWRASLAARGVGTSRLSAEIVALGLLMVVGTLLLSAPSIWLPLPAVTAALALVFLVTLGLVYALRGQATWRGVVIVSPVPLALGFGALALAAAGDGSPGAVGSMAAVALAADTAILIVRRFAVLALAVPAQPAYPSLFARRRLLFAVRFVLADLVPGMLVFAAQWAAAAACLGAGILVDRLVFYALAAQRTTEAEIEAVEGRI